MRNWILPENIADLLPPEARRVETLRRASLDLIASFGYELVQPPLIEYVDSLLTRDDAALDLKTFKLTDQLSGRQLGLRADITPQVARIDAHLLNRQGVTRLCYAGPVVHTLPDGIMAAREPLQLGAEIYGFAGVAADVEIVELMGECLKLADIDHVHLDIGHIGLFLALADAAGLQGAARESVFRTIQQKDVATLAALLINVPKDLQSGLLALPNLYGDVAVLAHAERLLPPLDAVKAALAELRELTDALAARGITPNFDLAELRSGYYHTGLVFAAYAEGWPNAVARGGRYDHVGEQFGRSRPATGFSLDLKELAWRLPPASVRLAILAPPTFDSGLAETIRQLRADGETVVVRLGEVVDLEELHVDRELVLVDGSWQVRAI
ncbi:ATP phosphoribosyltransferase regulatory subunit [Chitinimonas sp. BJB300]|uniref:ATP phosphoribosyltransferase regulatory subunit n=1 Tax=Chitinimonas sp. BJB300 TaxID=1559339 RepID=UPI000C0FC82B|nr:ATP phosphoribosyltransferase regulatory subunit [Chitinimonas sp. BJB300]PHV12989.1 ATP phosphoribosyltransferase regulatory subunit [Chitinimonas sp. BJB300]TSJ88954.1 ATP phosphoribosyltransferase regulatory subunit [Chitinimonas sp. BJB300]